jgi:hypothetical protein
MQSNPNFSLEQISFSLLVRISVHLFGLDGIKNPKVVG